MWCVVEGCGVLLCAREILCESGTQHAADTTQWRRKPIAKRETGGNPGNYVNGGFRSNSEHDLHSADNSELIPPIDAYPKSAVPIKINLRYCRFPRNGERNFVAGLVACVQHAWNENSVQKKKNNSVMLYSFSACRHRHRHHCYHHLLPRKRRA